MDQLALPGLEPEKKPVRRPPILGTPLTADERRQIGRLYQENEHLVFHCRSTLRVKYPSVPDEDLASCVDMAFIKTARIRITTEHPGKFSTLFYAYAHGEVKHWIRDSGYALGAPIRVRELGARVRQLMECGLTSEQAAHELGKTVEQVRDALEATVTVAGEPTLWDDAAN